jgi:hypothetical protein
LMPFFSSSLPWPQILHLPAISGDSRCSALALLLGMPMLPTWWWVKAAIDLHLEPFLLLAFMLSIVDRIHYYHHYYYAIILML